MPPQTFRKKSGREAERAGGCLTMRLLRSVLTKRDDFLL
jgi:hypothetical protein